MPSLCLNVQNGLLGNLDWGCGVWDYRSFWVWASASGFLPDGRLDLEFTPFVERVAQTNLLLIASEGHQMFGRYDGTIIADKGEALKVDGLIGWAEEHHARW